MAHVDAGEGSARLGTHRVQGVVAHGREPVTVEPVYVAPAAATNIGRSLAPVKERQGKFRSGIAIARNGASSYAVLDHRPRPLFVRTSPE